MNGYIHLLNYAEWYYTKYFPSRRMLEEKLLLRSGNEQEVVDRVMVNLGNLIVEDKVIESRVHSYISAGKTPRYIRTKMSQKKFDTALVDEILLSYRELLENPETYRTQLEKAIQKASQKGISKKALLYELSMKYSDARTLLSELMSEYSDQEILQKKAPELLRKYSQEQVVGKLLQKGFRTSDIYTVLRRR